MVKGETNKTKNGKYITSNNVKTEGNNYFEKNIKEALTKEFEKMSNTKLNGIDPHSLIQQYGIDFTRLFLTNFVHFLTNVLNH